MAINEQFFSNLFSILAKFFLTFVLSTYC